MPMKHLDRDLSDAAAGLSLDELARACALSAEEVDELVDYGALSPLQAVAPQRLFFSSWVTPLREACRLRRAYDLELFTVVILMDHLQRIDVLEGQLRRLAVP